MKNRKFGIYIILLLTFLQIFKLDLSYARFRQKHYQNNIYISQNINIEDKKNNTRKTYKRRKHKRRRANSSFGLIGFYTPIIETRNDDLKEINNKNPKIGFSIPVVFPMLFINF